MADDLLRMLALESALADAQRSVIAHNFLLRGLLTHLAMTQPDAFDGLLSGLATSGLYGAQLAAGELNEDVARELTALLQEVAKAASRGRSTE